MREVLIQDLGVPAENITVWLDSEATKSVFEHELPYVIRQLCPGDRFIFFYAGHGFFANGTNRLTTWDSHPANLFDTTVSLETVLLDAGRERMVATMPGKLPVRSLSFRLSNVTFDPSL